MAYGTKYRFTFDSDAHTSFRIDIQKDGYSSSVLNRALGQAPHLRRDSANNGICGTSLEIYAECAIDGEFAELYTTNAREFRVLMQMYVSGSWSTIWTGFVSPELYDEPEIAPPYDVCIVAVDGLGELEHYDFPANGRQSIRTHLQTILAFTGLNTYSTDIVVVSSLRGTSPTIAAATMLADTQVNLDHLSDGSCYDALKAIMETLHMTITRYNNKWLLIRDSDVAVSGSAIAAKNASGTSVSLPVAQYGSMSTNDWWPVGQMSTEVVPAKRKVVVGYPYRVNESLFENPETANPYCGVQPPPVGVDECPGWSSIGTTRSYDSGSAFYGNHARIGKIQQTITVEAQGSFSAPDQLSLVLSLAGIGTLSGPKSAKIRVKVFQESTWLKKKRHAESDLDLEWVTSDSYFELAVPVGYFTGQPNPEFTEYEIIIPYVSAGSLTIQLDGSDAGTGITFLVGGVYLSKPTINGYQDAISISNNARESENDITLTFGDAPYTANALKNIVNILSDGSGNLTSAWATSQFAGEFLSVIAMDYALTAALPRMKARGVLNVPKDTMPPAAFLNPDDIPMLFDTWDWNLLADEIEVSMTSIPAAEVTIETEAITQLTDEQAASYGGGSGSGSGGGSYYPGGGGTQFFEAVEENEEIVGAKALYDLHIIQNKEEIEEDPDTPEILKNVSELLRHLRLQVINEGESNEETIIVSDLTFASELGVVAGGIGGSGGGSGGGSIATLSDVTLTNLADRNILRYDALTSHWVNEPLAMTLCELTDVALGTPLDGQSLVYDATAGKWKPVTVGGGGGSVTVISNDATIGTSLTTLGTINGTPIKAKIAAYLEISQFTASNIVTVLDETPVKRATADASGNTIKTYYAANLVYSNNTLLLKNGSNTTLSTITGADIMGMLGLGSTDVIATTAWVGQNFVAPSAISDMATKTWVNDQHFLTSSSLSGYMLASDYTGTGTSVVNRAKADADGNIIKTYYAANLIVSGTELLLKNGSNTTLSTITGANIVTVIDNNAVARATGDASGNAFSTAYLRKDTDDIMSANLTIGSSSSNKSLTVYGSGSFTGTMAIGGDTTIGGNTTSTAKSLTVYGKNTSTAPALNIYGVQNNSTRYLSSLYVASDGLHITTSLNVSGNIVATGGITAGSASDRRLKKDIRTITLGEAADLLMVLNPVVYEWNDEAAKLGGLHGVGRGFIADEYLNLLPNAGRKIWGEYDAIDYEQVIPYLVAGWQQQNLRSRILESEVKFLKEEIDRLNRRMRDVIR